MSQPCNCGPDRVYHCGRSEDEHRIDELESSLAAARDELAALRELGFGNKRLEQKLKEAREEIKRMAPVVEAAKGFRDHGEAKNGTHATILFKALDALAAGETK